MLVLMPDRLACWIDDLGFFHIISKTGFGPVLASIAFHRGQEVDGPAFTSKISFSVSLAYGGGDRLCRQTCA